MQTQTRRSALARSHTLTHICKYSTAGVPPCAQLEVDGHTHATQCPMPQRSLLSDMFSRCVSADNYCLCTLHSGQRSCGYCQEQSAASFGWRQADASPISSLWSIMWLDNYLTFRIVYLKQHKEAWLRIQTCYWPFSSCLATNHSLIVSVLFSSVSNRQC